MKLDDDLIRELRARHAMSQEELAEAAGLSLRTVQRVEGRGLASLDTARAIAAVFDTEPGVLEDTRLERARVLARIRLGLRYGQWGVAGGAMLAAVGVIVDFAAGGLSPAALGICLGAIGFAAGGLSALVGATARRQYESQSIPGPGKPAGPHPRSDPPTAGGHD